MPKLGNSKCSMEIEQRINAFTALGTFLKQAVTNITNTDHTNYDTETVAFIDTIERASQANGWFTQDAILFSCNQWAQALTKDNIAQWCSSYTFPKENKNKTIAIILAGNIPLVGFHDFISVLIAGHNVKVKMSSNDSVLLPYLAKLLCSIDDRFSTKISFTKDKLTHFDAVIATGSNNTAKHFEYYFGKYPNIIRHNRNSVAVLTGKETEEELELVANDIFRYFGLGCRNVSKIYLPKDYNFELFFKAMYSWKSVIHETKYMNNYDYNKAVYLMSSIALLDNEFLLLKEDTNLASPIAVVYYEYYTDLADLKNKLEANTKAIQAITSSANIPNAIPLGSAQSPALWDYADGIDTISFLLKL